MMINEDSLLAIIDEQVALLGKLLPKAQEALQVCITIPAKNEENYLVHTLEAIYTQKDGLNMPLDHEMYEVIVLCHNCTDATYAQAEQFKKEHPRFNLHLLQLNSNSINTIGGARRVLMHISAARLPKDHAWIVSTDADTIPHADWLSHILSQPLYIDMVCGEIIVNTSNLCDAAKKLVSAKKDYNHYKTYLESLHIPDLHDPWPKHNHHSGPNMALRKHVYVAIDGIPPVAFLEDIRLFYNVKTAGYKIRHSQDIAVTTSGRLFSKTAGGLGSELKLWTTKDVIYRVEDINTLKLRYAIYQKIKALFYQYNPTLFDTIAGMSLLPKSKIVEIYSQSSIEEQMIMCIEQELDNSRQWKTAYPNQNIFEVNKAFHHYFKSVNSSSFAKA